MVNQYTDYKDNTERDTRLKDIELRLQQLTWELEMTEKTLNIVSLDLVKNDKAKQIKQHQLQIIALIDYKTLVAEKIINRCINDIDNVLKVVNETI